MKKILNNYRCGCGKMLLRGFVFIGEIEIKCRFCKKVNTIEGIHGNLSNSHRYILMAEKMGRIIQSTASAQIHLGFKGDDLLNTFVHEYLGFDPSYYATLWKKLSKDQKKSMLFQTIQYGKSLNPSIVQVGARVFTSVLGKEYFLFDVETSPIRKTLPMAPISRKQQAVLKK